MAMRVRLIDVANRAGVSRAAAGHVLLGSSAGTIRVGGKTAKLIQKVAREMGYHPNRSAQRLHGKTGNLIGLVMNINALGIDRQRMIALEHIAWARGYQLVMGMLSGTRDIDEVVACTSILEGQGASGIVFIGGGRLGPLRDDPRMPRHAVFCGIQSVIGDAPGVVLDLAHGLHLSTERFARQGKRHIGLVAMARPRNPYVQEAIHAISETVGEHKGMRLSNYFLAVSSESLLPGSESAAKLVDQMLSDGVDAVQTTSDLTAARLLQVMRAKGVRVPQDVAICGNGNVDIAELVSPSLTTIDGDAHGVAAALFDLLIAQLNGNTDQPLQRVFRPELIIRASA